jgi:Tfp pilus assembly protein FimV
VTADTSQPTASPPSATGTSQGGAGAKTYVVRAGDSLWLIAKRMLSPGASNADIARLVNQLWTLNASRIRTGNPNMLGVGVVLALP